MHYYEVLKPKQCTGKEFDLLLSLGWYPMGQSIFTTSHLFRDEDTVPLKVNWLRYSVASVPNKPSHRRIVRNNRYFTLELVDPYTHKEELDFLYEKYLESVDFDGYTTIENATFIENGLNMYETKAIIMRAEGQIISCGIFHRGVTSVASILHFYDPEYKAYSPGKHLILKTLDYCRSGGIEWYYPGYIIQGNPKMDYKLFLGRDVAQYYSPEPHPLSGSWLPFKPEILA